MSVRASPVITLRTLWITERSATMAATPTAMQTKKNSRRCHDARVSRTAMRRTNIIAARAVARPRPLGSTPAVAQHQLRVGQRRQLGDRA